MTTGEALEEEGGRGGRGRGGREKVERKEEWRRGREEGRKGKVNGGHIGGKGKYKDNTLPLSNSALINLPYLECSI